MSQNPRVLFLVFSNHFSGAEIVLCNYLKNNRSTDYYVLTNELLRSYFEKELPTERLIFSNTMQVASPRMNPIKWTFRWIANLVLIKKLIVKHRIGVLYGNNTMDIALLLWYKLFTYRSIPVISHIHDMLVLHDPIKNRIDFVLKRFHNRLNFILVPSEATKICIQKIVGDRDVYVIYNGVDCSEDISREIVTRAENWGGESVSIGFIGMFEQRKRPDLFVDVIQLLHKGITMKCEAKIIGKIVDEELCRRISQQIEQYQLPLKIVGEMDRGEVQKQFNNIDILLLVSDRDPLPTIVIEAMANAVVVVARNVDGIPEIIDSNKDGFIINYCASADEIAHLIHSVSLCSKVEIQGIMLNAHKKVRMKFSHANKDRSVQEIIGLIS